MLASSVVSAEAKLFAATTLKGKVDYLPEVYIYVIHILTLLDYLRFRSASSAISASLT